MASWSPLKLNVFVDFLLVLVAFYANSPSTFPRASTILAIIGSEKYHMVSLLCISWVDEEKVTCSINYMLSICQHINQ